MTLLAVAWLPANPVVTAPISSSFHSDELHNSLRTAEQPLFPTVDQQFEAIAHQFALATRGASREAFAIPCV